MKTESDWLKIQKALEKQARKLGLKPGTPAWAAYVYGGKRKMGWRPKRER